MYKNQLLCSAISGYLSLSPIRWQRNSSACQVPPEIAQRSMEKENYHKGDRGVGKEVSKSLFFRKQVSLFLWA